MHIKQSKSTWTITFFEANYLLELSFRLAIALRQRLIQSLQYGPHVHRGRVMLLSHTAIRNADVSAEVAEVLSGRTLEVLLIRLVTRRRINLNHLYDSIAITMITTLPTATN